MEHFFFMRSVMFRRTLTNGDQKKKTAKQEGLSIPAFSLVDVV